jgi:MFS family permease
MTVGSLAGTFLVLAWSRVGDLVSFYLIWAGIGVVMAAVLYEPAFAVIAKWFSYHRRRALTVLTLFAATSSLIFSPLANWLIEAQGWRAALVSLAAILAAITVPLHGLFLRRAPESAVVAAHDATVEPAAVEPGGRDVSVGLALRSRSFWFLTIAFVFSSFSTSAIGVHLIPYLLRAGYSAGFAATAAGLLGLAQAPGRLLFGVFGRVVPRAVEGPVAFLLQGSALLLLIAGTGAGAVVAAVVLFGMGNGIATLVRATVIADAYGSRYYGSIAGVTASCATVARAIAPVAASGIYVAFGYETLLWLLVASSALAAFAFRRARLPSSEASVDAARDG